ncbi:E3 ubiquitin-protein ligase E3D [Condylostylus longicornis]|uniref:E3 ubiquitin-protein ligase E3D n=1 Tax=Condylostylus longicornis TaxID=2530218 RepID=UPI00244E5377|nr:E3 ubiquitin-protein ligase E3D [Condylostylus longicornis]
MILQAALVEVRENIYCANIFLKFDADISSLKKTFKISLDKNCVLIKNDVEIIFTLILDDIELNAESLSNLIISNSQLSFRISLKNIQEAKSIQNDDTQQNKTAKKNLKLLIEPGCKYKLVCNSCENVVHPVSSFERILSFPSNYQNVNEFFCHNGPDVVQLNEKMVPNQNDLFYGLFFIIINLKNFCNIKETKANEVRCKRCLYQIGDIILNYKAVKLWNDSIKLVNCSNNTTSTLFNITNDSQICYQIIESILKDYELSDFNNRNQYFQFTKIVLLAKLADKKQFLMLNIIEKNLNIYKKDENFINRMIPGQSYKLFFKIENNENQALLRFWLNDINVHCLDISFSLFCKFVNILTNNSELFPEIFRNSQNDFLMSFVANL